MILRRLPDSRFSTVERLWAGHTAIILGGGPSLTQDQFDTVRESCTRPDVHAIAINASYLKAPWAELLYFADAKFYDWHRLGVAMPGLGMDAAAVRNAFRSFPGQRCSILHNVGRIDDDSIHLLRNLHGTGNTRGADLISLDPEKIATGRNSGYQALNISILAGAAKVLLLGFDGSVDQGGATHWHGGHPKATPNSAYEMYRRAFSEGEKAVKETGVRVLNCSPGTKITAFDRAELRQALSL